MTRLVTTVELDRHLSGAGLSVEALHELELDDGTSVVLLDDRGWSSSRPPRRWTTALIPEIQGTARTVVGPDEPFGDMTYERMAEGHWQTLAEVAHSQGVTITARRLSELPHDVVLGPQLTELLRNNA